VSERANERKAFLLRLDQRVHDAVARWARDDLRSVNAQIEFVLREALKRASRIPQPPAAPEGADPGTEAPAPETPAGAPAGASATESSPSGGPPTGD
jgi:hypothetical protein